MSPTGFMQLGMADFATSQALHVETDAVFQSGLSLGATLFLSKGLPGAAAIPRHQTQGRSLSSLRGAMLAVPPPVVGHGWEQLSQGEGRQILPSTTALEGRLVPLKCEGLRPLPLSRIWAPSL